MLAYDLPPSSLIFLFAYLSTFCKSLFLLEQCHARSTRHGIIKMAFSEGWRASKMHVVEIGKISTPCREKLYPARVVNPSFVPPFAKLQCLF